ncbi:MAG: RNA polymerase sigma factor [Sphingobacteriaceae bacterium]
MEKEFLSIIAAHQGIIHKVCRMYCQERQDTEDLFQESVLQLWKSYPSFNGRSKITTWMYRICLNTAITRLRKNREKSNLQRLSVAHENFADPLQPRMDITYGEALNMAINTLNRFDKALLMLYLDENSYKEMAEIMELSEANIAVKINRIKNKLKLILKP